MLFCCNLTLRLWQSNVYIDGDFLTSHKGLSLAEEEGVLAFQIPKPRYCLALCQLHWGRRRQAFPIPFVYGLSVMINYQQ